MSKKDQNQLRELALNSGILLVLLSNLNPPRKIFNALCEMNALNTNKAQSFPNRTKAYSECWLELLGLPFQSKIYESILEILDEKVLPNLKEPALLMDFYVDAYNTGDLTDRWLC